ncbi:MAG: FAD:protein FMN transferase [Deltaproteobacteria bacterium]|nr:FAD:protein FMN transferase [Deltaproteobacteria bacterium]
MKKIIAAAIILIIVLGLSLLYTGRHKIHTQQFILMDTIVEFKVAGDKKYAETAMKHALEELRRIDSTFGYQKSVLTELNALHSIRNQELYELIRFSLEINRASSGAFSITLRPILDAWGFSGTHAYQVPSEAEFEHWKSLPGDSDILLLEDGQAVKTHEGTLIDLAAVAKGYAADNAVKIMKNNKIAAGLVNAGGDIMAFGEKTWRVGIKHPRAPGIFATIPIRDKAIATSGDYERFFLKDGNRYCHILDPETGWPSQRYMSATVVAQSCAQADAWATALFVRGIEALEEVFSQQGMDWIVIDKDGKVSASQALKEYCPDHIAIMP